MSARRGTDVPVLPVVAVVGLLALLAGLIGPIVNGFDAGPTIVPATITVVAADRGRAIPGAFLGLSVEYPAVEAYAGSDPSALDPVFERLVRRLTGSRTVLRVGGDSADWTWWPVAGSARPRGIRYVLGERWLTVARALTRALGARLLLGLNLEADSPRLAGAEARALSDGLAPGSVLAFQLGNEPELYGSFAWYRTSGGRAVTGRPRDYSFAQFSSDFARFAGALPGLPLSGPGTGGLGWRRYLPQFLSAQPQVKLVTLHRYPLQLCFVSRSSPRYPTVAHLLSPAASTGLADSFKHEVAIAHARGLAVRVDELNTVSCGADRRVSQTFAAALWSLDALFELARVGVDGVNVHTFPGAGYELFTIDRAGGHWRAAVNPMYYGLLMFAQAARPGARLLHVTGLHASSPFKAWATAGPDDRIRIVLINKSASVTRPVAIHAPGLAGVATLERLRAPSLAAHGGVTLAGQSFGASTASGMFAGPLETSAISSVRGTYAVTVPPGSAAMLTVTAAARTSGSTQQPRARA